MYCVEIDLRLIIFAMQKFFTTVLIILSVFLFSCRHKKEHIPHQPLETEQPAKPDKEYFKKLAEHAKRFIPDAYHFKVNEEEEYFTVSVNNYKICTLTNEPGIKSVKGGVHTTEYNVKDENTRLFTYIIKYSFKPKRTYEAQQTADHFDDSVDHIFMALEDSFSHKKIGLNDLYKEEDRLRALLMRRPDFDAGRTYSVFITENFPRNFLECDSKNALPLGTMKKNLEDELSNLR